MLQSQWRCESCHERHCEQAENPLRLTLCFCLHPQLAPLTAMDMKIEDFTKTAPLSLLNDPTLLKTDALINGQWIKGPGAGAAGPGRFDILDPSTGNKL